MLINLSNHPSANWSTNQITAASKYGDVIDIPFPHIDPAFTTDEIAIVVEKYIHQIRKYEGVVTVHIMGEFTFCYLFINQCRPIGIPCIAATTNRLVQEDNGKKIVSFEFVQFRPFY